jgi:nitrogen fixation NifU-like protein
MPRFSATLMDHFQAPRNQGRLDAPDLIGVAGIPGQGRYLVLYLRLSGDRVSAVGFECHGCGVSIACGSALTELIEQRTLAECGKLSEADLVSALDGVPSDKADRVSFALAALRHALHQLGPPAALAEHG